MCCSDVMDVLCSVAHTSIRVDEIMGAGYIVKMPFALRSTNGLH